MCWELRMNNQSLYYIASRYQEAFMALADMEDIDEQTIADTLESIEGEVSVKIENTAAYVLNLKAYLKSVKDAKKRMAERQVSLQREIEFWENYLLTNMQRCGIQEISATSGEFSVKLGNCPESVDDKTIDLDLLPIEYKRHIPESWEPDKNKIKDAIKAGKVVPGARLIRNKKLIIK